MNVTIVNHGDKTLRVIIDKDNINDQHLAPAESQTYETRDEGTLELREMGA